MFKIIRATEYENLKHQAKTAENYKAVCEQQIGEARVLRETEKRNIESMSAIADSTDELLDSLENSRVELSSLSRTNADLNRELDKLNKVNAGLAELNDLQAVDLKSKNLEIERLEYKRNGLKEIELSNADALRKLQQTEASLGSEERRHEVLIEAHASLKDAVKEVMPWCDKDDQLSPLMKTRNMRNCFWCIGERKKSGIVHFDAGTLANTKSQSIDWGNGGDNIDVYRVGIVEVK